MTSLAPYLEGLRRHAERVACPRLKCLQPAGSTCVMPDGTPFGKQAAHAERVADADHQAAQRVECRDDLDGGCGAQPGELCRDPNRRPLEPRHPDHVLRLRLADVWREPVQDTELKGWPRRMSDDVRLARGRAALEESRRRAAAAELRAELRGDALVGEISQRGRQQLQDLDALLGTDPHAAAPQPVPPPREDPDDDDRIDYRRGPGRP